MKQIFAIFTALLTLLGEISVVTVKFLIFILLSPITIFRCLPRAWRHRSLKAGWEKFTWIWGAYWNHFNL